MPRFVILEHDHPSLHWDLLLEAGDVLRAWRLEALPVDGEFTSAAANFDHRLFYLDYEGPVNGDRGTVHRWDGGSFTYERRADDRLDISIEGDRLTGRMVLERLQGAEWRLRFDKT